LSGGGGGSRRHRVEVSTGWLRVVLVISTGAVVIVSGPMSSRGWCEAERG